MSWGHLSISAISQLLLARFGSNFKQRVLGTNTTDYNYLHDICPWNICPYQQYLSCYWPHLDQTLNKGSWEHMQQITTVTTTGTFVHISNISISKLTTFDFSLVPFCYPARKSFSGCALTIVFGAMCRNSDVLALHLDQSGNELSVTKELHRLRENTWRLQGSQRILSQSHYGFGLTLTLEFLFHNVKN